MGNRAILLGRLGSDPEVRYTASGKPVAKFSLATSETYKGETTTQWHRLVVWGKLAEICGQYLKKGQQAYFEGKIIYGHYEKDGKKQYSTEIVIDKMEFVGSKSDRREEPEDDIPF